MTIIDLSIRGDIASLAYNWWRDGGAGFPVFLCAFPLCFAIAIRIQIKGAAVFSSFSALKANSPHRLQDARSFSICAITRLINHTVMAFIMGINGTASHWAGNA
ncbi:hypothetical protein [Candidatus Methylocalor cossyra]|uniref:Uncharacterized protein n=1 Tax=Candidatus Methylocalor cossyra TaxID=3108543 RepID=A0ABP1CFX6_9GAMM